MNDDRTFPEDLPDGLTARIYFTGELLFAAGPALVLLPVLWANSFLLGALDNRTRTTRF